MAKALLFSDLHIHSHKDRTERLRNCIDTLRWIFQEAAARECEYVFFLGDLFHEREKIDVLNYLRTFECFLENESDFQVYLLVGNHDTYHKERWDVNSVRPLSAIRWVDVIQSPLSITLGGRKIDWLPYTDNPMEALEEFKKQGVGDILLAHLAVHGAIANLFYGTRADVIVEYDNDLVFLDADVFEPWERTFLGHYHGAQKLNQKVEYVGSPLQLSFGEAFQQKHIVILDLETLETEYVVNDFSPKHLIVSPQDIENEAYLLDGNFVRLAVEDMTRKDLMDIKRKVITESKPLSFDVKAHKDTSVAEAEDAAILEDVRTVLVNIEDILKKYVDEAGTPDGLDKDRLLRVGKKCLVKKSE